MSTSRNLSFSIVVNTNGRVDSLRKTIESFRRLQYDNFEVCVICGPTLDGTREMVQAYAARGELKYAECPELNLSMSRNIGIQIASGALVAFIDDDAIPEPEWLAQLAPAFSNALVGGAGGVTYDHTGYTFQARFILCDRFGDAQMFADDPGIADFNFPFSKRYPSLMGTNSAFRRSALVEIGGFDEEFEYYLDETDICSRMVDNGRHIVELDDAAVHHKFLPSHLRNEHRFLSTPFPVLKNKVYFALARSSLHHTVDEAIKNIQSFFTLRRNDLVWGVDNGRLPQEALAQFEEQADRAWRVGFARGLEGKPRTRPREWFGAGEPFVRFPTLEVDGGRETFIFLSQNYPPGYMAGNARHTHDIARAIAAVGHDVHVLTKGREFDRVDMEEGVWVHRIVPKEQEPRRLPGGETVPKAIWDYSQTMLDETLRIGRARPVHVVEGVSWDCETAAFVLDGRFGVATNIVTSLAHWLETHPEKASDRNWMAEFGTPMLSLERLVYAGSDRNIAASGAIIESLSGFHGAQFQPDSIARCAHGLEDMSLLPAQRPPAILTASAGAIKVLFVGRLELRKGIDTLFEAIGSLLAERNDVEFWIAGDNSLDIGAGVTAQEQFLALVEDPDLRERVKFLGPVADAELRWLYGACDVFVAPSRFESFGLIFVEAMMFGKPTIGCQAGGIGEVVKDGETGLLVAPGDGTALAKAIARLADDAELRTAYGAAGRQRYEQQFSSPVVARRRIELLLDIARRPVPADAVTIVGGSRRVDIGSGEYGQSLDRGASLVVNDVSTPLFISFCCHDWSGYATLRVNGVELCEEDLYSEKRTIRTVRIGEQPPGARIEVVRADKKNAASNATEVIVACVKVK